MSDTLGKIARALVLVTIALWILPMVCTTTIGPDRIGVRQSNLSGVGEGDLDAGWALTVPGLHMIISLPRRFEYLDYTADEVGQQQPLQIRTKDNNIVLLDVSVPYRIRDDEAWRLVTTGNHQLDANGRHRFQRLAEETTVSVLRERLAELTSSDFYSTDRRLEVSATTLDILNEKLAELHLEASAVLIRSVKFRPEYEKQLQQIQLNEQKKLQDAAAQTVANEQQKLDNYTQGTNALASAREQKWIERRANLERAYQVGVIDIGEDTSAGGARTKLAALTPEERAALVEAATSALQMTAEEAAKIDDAYLMGVQNVRAETLQYDQLIRAEADGVSGRLQAEADAQVAKVRGEFDAKRNGLLATAAGRAFVAWEAAQYVKFAPELNFASGDGVPSVLRLRRLALEFMGEKEK